MTSGKSGSSEELGVMAGRRKRFEDTLKGVGW